MRTAIGILGSLLIAGMIRGNEPRRLDHLRPTASIAFVQNQGQAPGEVLYQAVGGGFGASFFRDGFAFRSAGVEQRISFVDGNPQAVPQPLDLQPGKISFFRGKDPSRWASGLAGYARLRYANLYPGIDLLFYSNGGDLEYDFVVSPGADPSRIRLRVEGGGPVRITAAGGLEIGKGEEAVVHRPLLYQNRTAGKAAIEGRFVELPDGTLGFATGRYDRNQSLVIDPALNLLYSTYIGGRHNDESTAIALDAQNNLYMVGYSVSQDYPVSGNAYQPVRKNIGTFVTNIVLTKMSASGVLLYSTFVGGSGNDTSGGIVLDANGNAWFTGQTTSSDFPVTANAYLATLQGANGAFIGELSPDGSKLLYSSFFGGTGGAAGAAIAFNPTGNLLVAGNAGTGLQTTGSAYLRSIASGNAAFVAIFNPALSGTAQLLAATYYGAVNPVANDSSTGNIAIAMALDGAGNPWITGQTYTNNLPVTGNALQGTLPPLDLGCGGGGSPLNSAAYLAGLTADLSQLSYASYFSGQNSVGAACSEYGHAIAVDSKGNIYLAGTTASSTFPTTTGSYDSTYSGEGYSEFVAKFSPGAASLLWSTYIAGNMGFSFHDGLVLDSSGNVWISGTTQGGSNFPLVNAYQSTEKGGYDGHITELSNDGSQVLYSTYLGGKGDDVAAALAVDSVGNVYIAGYTNSVDFPLTANAFQSVIANGDTVYDGNDIFLAILGTGAIGVFSPISAGNTGDTTITVSGSGFQAGATCALAAGTTSIAAASVTVAADGTSITCTFALNGVAPGSYNVEVSNPGAGALVSGQLFTVSAGGQPQVWSNITGRSFFRVNYPQTFYITYGNSGTVDAYFTELWVSFPSHLAYQVLGTVYPTVGNATDQNLPALTDPSTNTTFIGFLLPVLPAGSSFSLPIQFTDATSDAALLLQTYVRPPWFDSLGDATAALTAAQSNPAGLYTSCVPSAAKPYLTNCLGDLALDASLDAVQMGQPTPAQPPLPFPPQSAATAHGAIGYFASFLAGSITGSSQSCKKPTQSRQDVAHLGGGILGYASAPYSMQKATSCSNSQFLDATQPCDPGPEEILSETELDCNLLLIEVSVPQCAGTPIIEWRIEEQKPQGGDDDDGGSGGACASSSSGGAGGSNPDCNGNNGRPSGGGGGSCSGSGQSADPNDKSGPAGDRSAKQYVGLKPLTYSIAFENEATATLPASQVVITDPLDPTKVDLTTVTLGTFAFGTNIITAPAGTNNFNTTVALNSSLSVRIQGSLNADNSMLTWTFTSIDPSTGLPPSDPTVGFLPPDTDGVKGQGSVTFSVLPKSAVTTETQITNQATVVFDSNAPINTPVWLNTMDVNPPVSSIQGLPTTESTGCFPVSWSGTDVGAGVSSYTLYVSDNGAPFTLWQTEHTAGSATYAGVAGHSYGFYSVAMDGAGNREIKTTADATTSVSGGAASCAQLTPSITWPIPSAIVAGTALGAAQLNATANVAGSFTYNPPAGTVLPLGSFETLTATFTPTDTADYMTAAAATTITVLSGYSPCDVAKQGSANVSDVQRIVNEALGAATGTDDLNKDGAVNLIDVQWVIDWALGWNCGG